jgi:hypothetical protein
MGVKACRGARRVAGAGQGGGGSGRRCQRGEDPVNCEGEGSDGGRNDGRKEEEGATLIIVIGGGGQGGE